AVGRHADGADLGILDVNGQLEPRTGGQVAAGLDEAAAQADVSAHAPARGTAESGLNTRTGAYRLALGVAALGPVLEIADAVGILLGLVDALGVEVVDRMRGKGDAPIRGDVSLHLNAGVTHQWRIVTAYPHHGAAICLLGDRD